MLQLKLLARKAHLKAIKAVLTKKGGRDIHLHLSKKVTAVEIMNLLKHQPGWKISGTSLILNIKELGFNWMSGLTEAIKHLVPKGEKGKILKKKIEKENGVKTPS